VTTVFRCDGCGQEKLAEVRDDAGTWRITTFPNIIAGRMKEAFRPHGEQYVQFMLDSIRRHEDDPLEVDATYRLECLRCLLAGEVTGRALQRTAEAGQRNPKIRLTEPGHVEQIPEDNDDRTATVQIGDSPPITGSIVLRTEADK
jgi:hypothetical protein